MRLKTGTSRLSRVRTRANDDEPQREAEAIRQCLIYLEREAAKIELRLTAHLIGVAAESIELRTPKGKA